MRSCAPIKIPSTKGSDGAGMDCEMYYAQLRGCPCRKTISRVERKTSKVTIPSAFALAWSVRWRLEGINRNNGAFGQGKRP